MSGGGAEGGGSRVGGWASSTHHMEFVKFLSQSAVGCSALLPGACPAGGVAGAVTSRKRKRGAGGGEGAEGGEEQRTGTRGVQDSRDRW